VICPCYCVALLAAVLFLCAWNNRFKNLFISSVIASASRSCIIEEMMQLSSGAKLRVTNQFSSMSRKRLHPQVPRLPRFGRSSLCRREDFFRRDALWYECRTSTRWDASRPGVIPKHSEHEGGLAFCRIGKALVPHPDKTETGGEDACFVLKTFSVVGVMDGVGGWAEEGVDASAYSRLFAQTAVGAVLSGKYDPSVVLAYAHKCTRMEGSCTACVASLILSPAIGNNSVLRVGNIGDTGAIVVPQGAIVCSTTAQRHDFNWPFQLGFHDFYPEADTPDDVDTYSVELDDGDALIMGTDGLWDNMTYFEVAKFHHELSQRGNTVQEIAQEFLSLAFDHSIDCDNNSPFSQAQQNSSEKGSEVTNGVKNMGGKMDDITVVIAIAEKN